MKWKGIIRQLYQICRLRLDDILFNLTKSCKYDQGDLNPTYNSDLLRATNPNLDLPFHIAIPYEQEKGKEYFVLCDNWSRHKCTKCAKISFYEPKYVKDSLILGKKQWILSRAEKEALLRFLSMKDEASNDNWTMWDDIKDTYDNEHRFLDNPLQLPDNLPIPNYMELPK